MLVTLASAGSLHLAGQTVQYTTTGDWGTGFNGQIVIRNTSAKTIADWKVSFDFDRTLDSAWDGRVLGRVGNRYTFGPAGWNSTIPVGGSVSFGMGGYPGNVRSGPVAIQLSSLDGTVSDPSNPATPTVPNIPTAPSGNPEAANVQIVVTQTSRWDGGFGASITVYNKGASAINGWTLQLASDAEIQSLWNGSMTRRDKTYSIASEGYTSLIPAGSAILLGYTAAGILSSAGIRDCKFNGVECVVQVLASSSPTPPGQTQGPGAIDVGGIASSETQLTIAQGARSYALQAANLPEGKWAVTSNNPSVVEAVVDGGLLKLVGVSAGRAALRIEEKNSKTARYLGVRVKNADGSNPGMPSYLSLGSVSEDIPEHLNFWQSFEPGAKNKRVDIRYIYLNGGPSRGWDTWANFPGARVTNYIRNSRMLGMIPFFVYYNIPDESESYQLDLAHAQDANYLSAYFKNLKFALDLINKESPDDVVGMVLEPDFIGYLAQNANAPASAISAATRAAYQSGVLERGTDPAFPDTVAGLVQAINYVISKTSPQVFFGWQINLWASPAGGWTTPVPVSGVIRLTDGLGVAAGRLRVQAEAAAITSYYVQAGIASHGAKFVSIDKYGLDAGGVEGVAATDPSKSTWFWNIDHWNNYLAFTRGVNATAKLPVILWQLPAGHINNSLSPSPYAQNGQFPTLTNQAQSYEDSAPVYFFGDRFDVTSGPRLTWFGTGQDPKLQVAGSTVTWGPHMQEAAAAGVISMMFGAGVGHSTTNVGTPPTDNYWWITKAQQYLAAPVSLPGASPR